MKKAPFSLVVLLLCLVCNTSMLAAAKIGTSPTPVYQQELPTIKKRQNKGFLKRAWQAVFPKKQLRQKPPYREARLSFGGWALVAVSLAAIAIFLNGFWALAIITWAACMVLGVIGLFKDESKALAIIALGLGLVLPVIIAVLFSIYCCGP